MFHNDSKSELSILHMQNHEGSILGRDLPACHLELPFLARLLKSTSSASTLLGGSEFAHIKIR